MNRRRIAALTATAALIGLGAPLGGTPAQANRCAGSAPTVPPTLPNAPQTGVNVAITGGYWGVGGAGALDPYGCVAGVEVADTRVLPPRADFAIVVVVTKCQPGQQLPTSGSSLRGLGANVSGLNLRCTTPDAMGRTAYVGEPLALRPSASGTITAVVNFNGTLLSAQSRSALPVDQPA